MDCFKDLRGLKRANIVGDLEKEYSIQLAATMMLLKTSFSEASYEEDLQYAKTFSW